jgi:hypothetical protein
MPRRRLSRRAADVGMIVLFLALIGLPVSRNLAGSAASAATERRVLAPMPKLHLRARYLRAFPEQFEAYYNDQFGFRENLIRWMHMAQVQWLRVSGTPKVILGRHGWLFFNDVPLDCDQAIRPFTPDQLATWQHLLEARRDWLAERDIRFLFVIAPDKQTIYPECLPRTLTARHVEGLRLNQLLEHLRQHSDVAVVDLRDPLLEAKQRERIYHQTDSHWNDRGAFIASQTLAAALSPWFAGMQPLSRTAFQEETQMGVGDCAFLLNMPDRIHEDEWHLRPRQAPRTRVIEPCTPGPLQPTEARVVVEQDNPRLPQALVFRDSFGAAMIPFLAANFRRSVYVWQDYPTFDRDLVIQEHPDVVVQEMVERKLAYPDLVPSKFLYSGRKQQVAYYLSKDHRAWLTCLQGE